jgi:hypothetical protein
VPPATGPADGATLATVGAGGVGDIANSVIKAFES